MRFFSRTRSPARLGADTAGAVIEPRPSSFAAAAARAARRYILAAVSIVALIAVLLAVGLDSALSGLAAVRMSDVAIILALLGANFVLVSVRLLVLLRQFGWPVGWRVAFRATAAGQAAGLFLFQIVGQLVGRQAVLQRSGISPAATTATTVLERIVLLMVAAGFGSLGALHVFGSAALAEILGGIPWLEVTAGGSAALALVLRRTAGPAERHFLSRLFRRGQIGGTLMIAGLTAAGQLLVIASLVVGLRASAPEVDALSLLAAAAVVSFAAGMPISINGWGVRELAAVHVFGRFGVPPGEALAISIAVGLCATLVVVLAALPLVWAPHAARARGFAAPIAGAARDAAGLDDAAFTRAVVWLLTLGIAVLVFYQVPISLLGSVTTVNLADPLALVALALFCLHVLSAGNLPAWRSRALNLWLLLAALAMVAAFAIGASRFGITAWALGNRLTGLLLLAGYLSAGALAVAVGGTRAQRQLVHALLLAAATVTVVHLMMRTGAMVGLVDLAQIPWNFEAYSGNRNAYAFQMVAVVAAAAVWSPVSARAKRAAGLILPMALALLGLRLSQSRAGLITAAVLTLLSLAAGQVHRRSLLTAIALVVIMVGAVDLPSADLAAAAGLRTALPSAVQIASDTERWVSLTSGLAMWLDHPLFGAGLGAFVQGHLSRTGTLLVIHNSLVWLLAEFGVVGTLPWVGLFLAAALAAWRGVTRTPSRWPAATLGVLLAFALASLVHDLLYQRLLWLLLGTFLAVPDAARRVLGAPTGDDGARAAELDPGEVLPPAVAVPR